jgi:hypothetical protein
LIGLVSIQLLKGQSVVGGWDSYTSSLYLRDFLFTDNLLYAASSGGLLQFEMQSQHFTVFGQREGFTRTDLSCIARDKFGNLWLGSGSPSGEIMIWNPIQAEVQQVIDQNLLGESLTAISALAFYSQGAFAAYQKNVEWGLLHFNIQNQRYQYKDFYCNFPMEVMQINVLTVVRDTLWMGTTSGLLYADLHQSDLKPPEAWGVLHFPENDDISSIVVKDDTMYVSAGSQIFLLSGTTAHLYNSNLSHTIERLTLDQESWLIASTAYGAFILQPGGEWEQLFTGAVSAVLPDYQGGLWAATTQQGLLYCLGSVRRSFIPNTILDNIYTALHVDENGQLIAGTQKGISLKTNRGWYNIRGTYYDIQISDHTNADWNYFVADTIAYSLGTSGRIFSLVKRSDGQYFASLYGSYVRYLKGGGLLQFDPENLMNYVVYDTSGGHLTGSAGKGGEEDFMGIEYLALDAHDNIWISNQYAQNDNVVAVLTPTGEWVHFSIDESFGYLNDYITVIAFDSEDRVWFGSEVHTGDTPSNGGIIVMDYSGTLADKSDDQWTFISRTSGLEDNSVFSLAFDHDGTLWIMTASGIQEASVASNFPERIFSNIKPPVLTSVPFTKECKIRVDGLNNKWFATVGSGVKVFTYNGRWLNDVEGFTTHNSGLLDDTILDIAFYSPEGLVYLATTKGISIYKSQYAVYGNKFRELKIFPSPYKIPSPQPLVIDGLLQGSEVRIFTLDGTFIRHLKPQESTVIGQQAFWDGKNQRGDYVSSGIYLCLAYTPEGDTIAGKIAVVRK